MTKLPALLSSVRLPAGKLDITPVFNTSIRLPAGELDEERAIECIAVFCSKMLHKFSEQFNREWTETTIQQKLREGRVDFCKEAVEEAEAGDEVFGAALRYVYVQITRRELPEKPGHLHIRTYGERVMLQPDKRRSGRPGHDNRVRDCEITAIIWYTCRALGVPAFHNRGSRRTSRSTGVSLVVAALRRNGVRSRNDLPLNETHVRKHIWNGPLGRLTREELDKYLGRGPVW